MREIIKQLFTNIESEWEKIERAIQEASKKTLGYLKRATPVELLTAETINLVEERRKLKSKQRGNPQAAKHNCLFREIKTRAKKDRELHIQGICKEVKEPRLHNKTQHPF